MNIPSEVKPASWGAVGGFVAALALGFGFLGWMTGDAAEQMANQRASDALVAALAPVCAATALRQPDAVTHVAAIKDISSSFDRRKYVQSHEWVPTAQEGRVRNRIADACARILFETKDGKPTAL